MATATLGRADIEEVVRKILAEERPEDGRATLKAIQRVSSLLTEQVIPSLPDHGDEDGELDSGDESGAESNSQSFARRSAPVDDDTNGDTDDAPDGGDPTAEVLQPVMEAFETLYHALSPEQASALAEFFTAVGQELSEGEDEEDDDEHTDSDRHTA